MDPSAEGVRSHQQIGRPSLYRTIFSFVVRPEIESSPKSWYWAPSLL